MSKRLFINSIFFKAKKYCFLAYLIALETTSLFAQIGKTEIGIASYYHEKFVGRKTATGEIFTQNKMTAAHKNLPLNSWVKVTNLNNDSTVILRINDRMPQSNSRSIDLTTTAAKKLNYLHAGLTKVKIEVISDPTKRIVAPPEKQILSTQIIQPNYLHQLTFFKKYPILKYPVVRYYVVEQKTIYQQLFNR